MQASLAAVNLDGGGVHGYVAFYTMVLFLFGSAVILFSYFYYNKQLDMDEEPKLEMLREEEDR